MTDIEYNKRLGDIIARLVAHGVCPARRRKDCTDCLLRIEKAKAAITQLNGEAIGPDYPVIEATDRRTTWHFIPAGKNQLKAELRAVMASPPKEDKEQE